MLASLWISQLDDGGQLIADVVMLGQAPASRKRGSLVQL